MDWNYYYSHSHCSYYAYLEISNKVLFGVSSGCSALLQEESED